MNFLTQLATFVMGPWGISLIVIGVVGSFLGASAHMLPPRSGFVSAGCGAMAFVGAYVIRTFLAGGGGGF